MMFIPKLAIIISISSNKWLLILKCKCPTDQKGIAKFWLIQLNRYLINLTLVSTVALP